MNSDSLLLFTAYAVPCAGTLVNRGKLTKEEVAQMVDNVSKGIPPKAGTEKLFPVADAMCSLIAKQMGKKEVDQEVIHEYFLYRHSAVVDERYELMRDFDPQECRTYPGKVVKVDGEHAIVETVRGRRTYKTALVKDIKAGETVSVHFDFIVERITEQMTEKMRMVASNEKRNKGNNTRAARSSC